MNVRRLLRFVAFHLRQLGLLGGVGMVLVIAAALYTLVFVPQREAERAKVKAEISRWQNDRNALESRIRKTMPDGADPAARSAFMPTVADTPQLLLTLEDIAHRHGLQIKRNDYRYIEPVTEPKGKGSIVNADANRTDTDRILEVKVAAPASGSYRNVRAFIAEAMQRLPTLALDEMALKREAIDKGEVQAQLRFTLFVRNET